jgi:hypothetical protein
MSGPSPWEHNSSRKDNALECKPGFVIRAGKTKAGARQTRINTMAILSPLSIMFRYQRFYRVENGRGLVENRTIIVVTNFGIFNNKGSATRNHMFSLWISLARDLLQAEIESTKWFITSLTRPKV